ncbi:MAG: glycosyltransferase family 4 protein [Proteobacteria bacterium]|nr:glycosyltransferase family 4 protein [Pseudomonadota bacterium]
MAIDRAASGHPASCRILPCRQPGAVQIADPGGSPAVLVPSIVRAIDELGIRIIHSSDFRTSVAAVLAARQRRVRLVATAHGWIANTLRRRLVRFADKALLRMFDRVVVVSAATRQLIPRWWLPDRKVLVLRNALVLESYGAEIVQRPRRPVKPQERVTVVNVGASPGKRPDDAAPGSAEAATRVPNLHLVFAGVGPLESALRAFVDAAGMADHVEFRGYVKDMPTLYADCDLLVQSSFTEGLPNVILEAAYLRLPIVATAVGGTAEVVRQGETACLIKPSLEDLVAGIESFLRDPGAFAAMAEAGHRDIVRDFSFQVRTQKIMNLYQELAGGAAC